MSVSTLSRTASAPNGTARVGAALGLHGIFDLDAACPESQRDPAGWTAKPNATVEAKNITVLRRMHGWRCCRKGRKRRNILFSASDQTRLPAEFKHINKRRKRN